MTTAIAGRTPFGCRISQAVQTLTPGYFALTMASGIISVGLELEGFTALSAALLVVCAVSYAVILVLSLVRFVRFRADMRRDFLDPARAFGFFTFIAGTNVLAVRLGMAGYDGGTPGRRGARLGGARLRGALDCRPGQGRAARG